MAGEDFDSPPPYHTLKEDSKLETNATEVTIPHYHDDLDVNGVLFEHKDNRIGFVQKVILIKLLQVLAVAIPLLIFVVEPYNLYRYMQHDRDGQTKLTIVSSLLFWTVFGLIHYCDNARFMRPYNFMFLLAYPLFFGFFVSVIAWGRPLGEIFTAWVLFIIVLFCMLVYSILALQTKIEFRTRIALPIATGVFIVSYGLTVPFIWVDGFSVLYYSLVLYALTAYMLYDLQIMMSRTYRIHLSPSDFVKGALIMHVDYCYMIKNLLKKNENHNANDDA